MILFHLESQTLNLCRYNFKAYKGDMSFFVLATEGYSNE